MHLKMLPVIGEEICSDSSFLNNHEYVSKNMFLEYDSLFPKFSDIRHAITS